ncbi:MAG: hypothetical protein JWP01_369, partial [Myxococcales bacterium]|nr:hypothetical protein [Myxococcales bacterium]
MLDLEEATTRLSILDCGSADCPGATSRA